eukprot:12287943-Alexandrium_andersonii.AAC.2
MRLPLGCSSAHQAPLHAASSMSSADLAVCEFPSLTDSESPRPNGFSELLRWAAHAWQLMRNAAPGRFNSTRSALEAA